MRYLIPVAVTLGSPNADCANFGVCSLEPLGPETWAAYRPPHLRAAKAWIALEDDGPLVLHFPKDGVLYLFWLGNPPVFCAIEILLISIV
jgi:hypothetical protein